MPNKTSVYERFKAQFTSTLRELCNSKGSISIVCRDLQINRQQFSKYLSGANLPSAFVIQRFAHYFGVDPSVFFLSSGRKSRFDPQGGAVQMSTASLVNDGFYLEYALAGRADTISVGLWRFEKEADKVFCHGEIPRHRAGTKSAGFDSFNGQIISTGTHLQLMAVTQCGTSAAYLTLDPLDESRSDLIAARTTSGSGEDAVQCVPSILRFLGSDIDITELLTTRCGIVKTSRLDERSAAILKLLSERVTTSGNGFRLSI